jgi:hypothetical protein
MQSIYLEGRRKILKEETTDSSTVGTLKKNWLSCVRVAISTLKKETEIAFNK